MIGGPEAPAPAVPPSHGWDKIVVAAGRLERGKRYDLLIRAFATVAAALLRLINDDAQQEAMAAAALKNSQRYDPALIAEQYEQLFDRLAARTAIRRRRWPRRNRPAPPPEPVLGPAPTSAVPTVDALVTASYPGSPPPPPPCTPTTTPRTSSPSE
jgi:hypothetical protein